MSNGRRVLMGWRSIATVRINDHDEDATGECASVLVIGLGMGADTGQWLLAILGGIGTLLLVMRLASL